MTCNFTFAIVATVMALGLASPALAQSHSASDCTCRGAQIVGPNGSYYASPYYDYVPGRGEQPYWPSAAAMGNSH
jgi:hypothetical protein